ncbi:Agenet domain containing protein [Trema orientale]|uniref:Agenet domain containing protein n=1 Tax=Trema orientale TaxID=63057 RepID=A0A2P5CQQ0_TREOI|nr:Agenet domain containing protein [Trema orientale]
MEKNNKYFQKGSKVEVWSEEDGFENAWFPAVVVEPPSAPSAKKRKRSRNDDCNSVVRYDHMLSDDGSKQPLVEKVKAYFLRPAPPYGTTADRKGFEPNDVVDALYDDVWWTGVVFKVIDDDTYTVFFKKPPDLLEFKRSQLRPHWVWAEHKWVRPEKQAMPEGIFGPGTAVEVNLKTEDPSCTWIPAVFLVHVDTDSALVKYEKSSDNGGKQVVEKVVLHVEQIRLRPPEMHAKNFDMKEKVVQVTPDCQERYDQVSSTGRTAKSPALNIESAGSVMDDTGKETTCSTNKEDNQKESSPRIDKSTYFASSNKETVNHTSNGDESAKVILTTNDERIELSKRPLKIARQEVGEGKNQAIIPLRTLERGGSLKMKSTDLQPLVAVTGASAVNMADKDVFEPEHVMEEFEISGMLVQPKGITGSSVENSGPPPIQGEQNDNEANDKLNGKEQQPELLVANSQAAEAGEDLRGSWAVVSECATDKSDSPVITGLQLTDALGYGRALVSPTSTIIGSADKALSVQTEETTGHGRPLVSPTSTNIVLADKASSMQIEETLSPTNVGELDALGDGRALVSPTSTNIGCSDKALQMQIEETLENGRPLVSPMSTNIISTDKALSMQIEETHLTNVDESDEWKDGRVPVSTASAVVVSIDKALSMQIEETQGDGRCLVSPTSMNVISTDKALPTQIEETHLSNDDESGNIEQEGTQNLPFVKSSPLWQLIESIELFKKLPQKPHFRPLVKCKEIEREASAIKNMIDFAYLIDKTSKLQEDDSREYFGSIMEELAKLEELGFNVKVVQGHLSKCLEMKVKFEDLQDQLKGIEIQITEHSDKKAKIDGEVAEIDKEIKRIVEKRATLMFESNCEGSKVSNLLSEAAVINEAISTTSQSFRNQFIPW